MFKKKNRKQEIKEVMQEVGDVNKMLEGIQISVKLDEKVRGELISIQAAVIR